MSTILNTPQSNESYKDSLSNSNESKNLSNLQTNLSKQCSDFLTYGKLHLIIGPMFSGKSTELLRLIRRNNYKKKTTVVVAYMFDDRYSASEVVVTHDKHEYPAIKTWNLLSIKDKLMQYDVIGIDEGQFYPDIVDVCEELVNCGKIVIVSALNGNFKREPFEVISKLLSKAETIQNITAICFNCNEDANYTLRLSSDEREVIIGGEDMYKPSCRSCHNYFFSKYSSKKSDMEEILNEEALEKLSKKTIYSLEGNIGAGKSTLLKMIKSLDSVYVIEEPVAEWQNVGGHNLLDKFYEDQSRWIFSFQMYIFYTKLNALLKAAHSDKKVILMERSFLSDEVFFNLSVKSKTVSEMEAAMFGNIFNLFKKTVFPKVTGFVYINTPVQICMDRIRSRNRHEETTIPEDYIINLKNMFDDMMDRSDIPKHYIEGEYCLINDVNKVKSDLCKFMNISC